jgi:hypothetical protein
MNEDDLKPLLDHVRKLDGLFENCGIEYDPTAEGDCCHMLRPDQLLAMIMDVCRSGEAVYNDLAAQIPYAETYGEKVGRGVVYCDGKPRKPYPYTVYSPDDEIPF